MCVCVGGCSSMQPLPKEGHLCLRSPFVFAPCVWSDKEACEGMGIPIALLPQSFSHPVSSLSSGKMPKYTM